MFAASGVVVACFGGLVVFTFLGCDALRCGICGLLGRLDGLILVFFGCLGDCCFVAVFGVLLFGVGVVIVYFVVVVSIVNSVVIYVYMVCHFDLLGLIGLM